MLSELFTILQERSVTVRRTGFKQREMLPIELASCYSRVSELLVFVP